MNILKHWQNCAYVPRGEGGLVTKLAKLNQIQTYINDQIINFIFPMTSGKIILPF